MRAVDGFSFTGASTTQGPFTLAGGLYGVDYIATWSGGTATLERRAADGVTFVPVATAFSANGYTTVNLPRGVYQVVIATATGVGVSVLRIPGE